MDIFKEKIEGEREVIEEDFEINFENDSKVSLSKKKVWFLIGFMILLSVLSFGLGRLSIYDEIRPNVNISAPLLSDEASLPSVLGAENVSGSTVVGSKNGTKYHFPWCSGAQRINPSNLVTFASIEEARKAGYTPASNCKGLK